MASWPQRWGFLCDPQEWKGKTIEFTEELSMEYGSTHEYSIALLFTDGTRGWVLGRNSKGIIPSPSEKAMSQSLIIRPDEFAQYQEDKMRRNQSRQMEERRRKEAELERLKKELGK